VSCHYGWGHCPCWGQHWGPWRGHWPGPGYYYGPEYEYSSVHRSRRRSRADTLEAYLSDLEEQIKSVRRELEELREDQEPRA